MNEKWSEKTRVQKVMDIIAGIAFLIWIILEALERKNLVRPEGVFTSIAMAVVCVCEAVSYWNQKRAFSYVAIAGTVCLIVVTVLQILLLA